jgi:hypothetical protein
MGLDVYLYRKRNEALDGAYSAEEDDGEESISKKWISAEQPDSAKYPQHLFKVGYFRSSYNEGGLSCVLRQQLGLPDLDDLLLYPLPERDFHTDHDGYIQEVDWSAALGRVQQTLTDFRALVNTPQGRFGTMFVRVPCQLPLSTNLEAKKAFMKQLLHLENPKPLFANEDGSHAYTARDGFFCTPALKVMGILPGQGLLHDPGVYVVFEHEDPAKHWQWYIEALEIVQETIEWVLAQPAPSDYVLGWSS